MKDIVEKIIGLGVATLVGFMVFESFFAGVLHL